MRKLIQETFPLRKNRTKLNTKNIRYLERTNSGVARIDPENGDQEGLSMGDPLESGAPARDSSSAIVVLNQGTRQALEEIGIPYNRAIHSLQWRILRVGYDRINLFDQPKILVSHSQKKPGLFHLQGIDIQGQCLFHGNVSVCERVFYDTSGKICAIIGRPCQGKNNNPYFIHPLRLRDTSVVTSLPDPERRKVEANLDTLIAHGYPNGPADWQSKEIIGPLIKDTVSRVFPH